MTDTLVRHWTMLKRIPAHPCYASTREIHQYLCSEGFEVSERTVQRDLLSLSTLFPFTWKEEGKAYAWQWLRDARLMDIPSMSPNAALAMSLTRQYLEPLLPRSSLQALKPYFDNAAAVLGETGLHRWRERVRLLHRGPALKPPTIRRDVLERVYQALLEQRQFKARYRPRNGNEARDYQCSPLGLVVKDGISYLVCTLWDYQDVKQLALHRMSRVEVSDAAVNTPSGFSLDEYIHDAGGFAYPLSPKTLQLKARFNNEVAYHLQESKLADDQKLAADGAEHTVLKATVPDNQELRWWLLGFGDKVEVLGPKKLRAEFVEIARSLGSRYRA